MNLELTEAQVHVLRCQLTARMEELEREAARTDLHELQHALAQDVCALREVLVRLPETKR